MYWWIDQNYQILLETPSTQQFPNWKWLVLKQFGKFVFQSKFAWIQLIEFQSWILGQLWKSRSWLEQRIQSRRKEWEWIWRLWGCSGLWYSDRSWLDRNRQDHVPSLQSLLQKMRTIQPSILRSETFDWIDKSCIVGKRFKNLTLMYLESSILSITSWWKIITYLVSTKTKAHK